MNFNKATYGKRPRPTSPSTLPFAASGLCVIIQDILTES